MRTSAYDDLRRLARRYFSRERRDHTLEPTALVHEAWVRLAEAEGLDWTDREHFVRTAARTMRRILCDHARRCRRGKRHGGARVTLTDGKLRSNPPTVDLLDLDRALVRLGQLDPEKVEIVELRFFAGLTTREVAACLGLSRKTVERQWARARAWLLHGIERGLAS